MDSTARNTARGRFTRRERIRYTREFERVRSEGVKEVSKTVVATCAANPDGSSTRIGVISSRKVGSAVKRNRARRLMREAFRSCRGEISRPVDLVLIARKGIHRRKSYEVAGDLRRLLNRIHPQL